MRNLTTLLLLLSLCSVQLVFSIPSIFDYKIECCSKITKTKPPVKNIVSYKWTDSSCPIKAVIFQMKINKTFCADPSAEWIDHHMNVVDRRRKTKRNP